MAGRPKRRARTSHNANNRPQHPTLAAIYAEEYSTFDALRTSMVQNGIVDYGLSPYDVIQRAIDDTSMDYLLVRQKVDRDTNGNPEALYEHQLYDFMEHIREASVRYATFAMQYDIQKRQLKLSETRIALLAATLRTVLTNLGLNQEQIREVPKLLIEAVQAEQARTQHTNPARNAQPTALDPNKAEAIAEILHHDSEVAILDADE